MKLQHTFFNIELAYNFINIPEGCNFKVDSNCDISPTLYQSNI